MAGEPNERMTGEAVFGFPVDECGKSATESASRVLSGVSKLARKADIHCSRFTPRTNIRPMESWTPRRRTAAT
jgi:hypothetical protein